MKTKKLLGRALLLCGCFKILPIAFAGQLLMDFEGPSYGAYQDLGVGISGSVYLADVTGSSIKNPPSSPHILYLSGGTTITINVTNGFTALSLYYFNGHTTAGSLTAYSGLNGSGSALASVSLPQTPAPIYEVWVQKTISHGSAQSFVLSGLDLYVGADDIRITGGFKPRIYSTPTASSVSSSTATLNASVNPEGDATTAYFQYSTDFFFGSSTLTAPQSIGSGTADIAVTQIISGLNRGTTYYFRAIASNSVGSTTNINSGYLTTLQTTATTLPASSVTASGAVLNGSVTPNELNTSVYFQYANNAGLTGASTTSTQNIGSGTSAVSVNAAIMGLSPGIYYYRVVAVNAAGTFNGTILSVSVAPGYTVTSATSGTFTDISGTGTQIIPGGVDDNPPSSAVNIGFSFPFFGVNYTSLYASPNGLLTFGSGYTGNGVNFDIASVALPNQDTIAVLWDDWVTDAGVFAQTTGTVGQRVFIVQWNGHHYNNGAGSGQVTFQVQLFEDSSDILMVYSDTATGAIGDNGSSATVGIRKVDAPANGRYVLWSYNSAVITSGTKIRFSPLKPIVSNLSASGLAATSAVLRADVNPNSSATTAFFQYGLTTSYGSTAAIALSPNDGAVAQTVSSLATGLTASVTYHYRVVASNSLGTTTSGDATFVLTPPSVSQPPQNVVVAAGSNATFTVTAVGTGPLSYQWLYGGSPISSATNGSLTISNVTYANQGDAYQVIITNAYGSVTSSVAYLNLDTTFGNGFVSFVSVGNPGNSNDVTTGYGAVPYQFSMGKYEVTLNQYAAFLNAVAATDTYALYNTAMGTDLNIAGISRSGASGSYAYTVIGNGTRPISYVSWFDAARFANWLHNGKPSTALSDARYLHTATPLPNGKVLIVGGYNASALSSVELFDPANGTWIATGGLNASRHSQTATLLPNGKVLVSGGDNGGSVVDGSDGSAGGGGSGGSIWLRCLNLSMTNSSLLANGGLGGSTVVGATCGLPGAGGNGAAGRIRIDYVAGSFGFGSAGSLWITNLFLISPPSITQQPQNQTVIYSSNATFTVSAAGGSPFVYQWLLAGSPISNATNSSLTLSNVTFASQGGYSVIITNAYGSVTSALATLTIYVEPSGYAWTNWVGLPGASGSTDATNSVARFNSPQQAGIDTNGTIYLADRVNHTIRVITQDGIVTRRAGTPGASGSTDATGSSARFQFPNAAAVDGAGNVYVADGDNHTIRKITPAGVVTTLAGLAGSSGSTDATGSASRFNKPFGVAVDTNGNVYVADTLNHTIRKITAAGAVTTFAGTAGASGTNNGTGTAARFYLPKGVAVDSAGNVLVADTDNGRIRKVTPGGVVTTVASGFNFPFALTVDSIGNIFVTGTLGHTLHRINPAGIVTQIGGVAGSAGSADGVGFNARFNTPGGIVADAAGNLYAIDSINHRISKGMPVYAPVINTPLAGQTVMLTSNVTFQAGINSSSPASYQWYFNGTAITSETNSVFTFANAGFGNAGNYLVIVTNAYGSVTSSVAALTVQTLTVANGDTLVALANAVLKTRASALASNDVAGTVNGSNTNLAIFSVSSTSSNGGSVSLIYTQAWVGRYDGAAHLTDQVLAAVSDSSGNVIVAGISEPTNGLSDWLVAKYAPDGTQLWADTHNGPANTADAATALTVDGAGNIYVTGHSYQSGTSQDYFTRKYAPNGALAWEQRRDGGIGSDDFPRAVAVDSATNVYVTGYSTGSGTGYDIYTVKYSPSGVFQWADRFHGALGDDLGQAIAIDSSNNVFVAGNSRNINNDDDMVVLKLTPGGTRLWSRTLNRGRGRAVAVDAGGNVVVTGTQTPVGANDDFAVVKWDGNGTPLWTNIFNGPVSGNDDGRAITVGNDGSIYAAGIATTATARDFVLFRLNANGTRVWTNYYNAYGYDDIIQALKLDAFGRIYVAGYSLTPPGTKVEMSTVAYHSNGQAISTNRFNPNPASSHAAIAIALDATGGWAIAGDANFGSSGSDAATVKFEPFIHYTPPTNFFGTDSFTYVIQDSAGLVATGTVTVTVLGPPVIVSQTFSAILPCFGGTTNLSVQVSGTEPFYYRWYENVGQVNHPPPSGLGILIVPNGTNNLTVNASLSSWLYYTCVVSNSYGVATSATILVTASDTTPPAIVSAPTNQFIFVAPGVCSVIIPDYTTNVVATDCSGFSITQSPAPGTSRVFDYSAMTDGFLVGLTITDGAGNITNRQFTAFVRRTAPYNAWIQIQGVGPTLVTNAGAAVTLVAGADNCFYGVGIDWYRNGVFVGGGGTPMGPSSSATYSIPSLSPANAGSYYCVVTDSISSHTATSTVVTVSIAMPPNYFRLSGGLLGNGSVRLSFLGDPGVAYALDRTFNLDPPVWLPQGTGTALPDGTLIFTNTPNPATNNFWRVRTPP